MSNLVGATTAVFPVHLSIASNEIINVGWRTIDGTAKGGIDYQALDGVVRFLPGEIEGKIEVLVYGGMEPSAADSSKIFYIRLDPPSGAILESSLLACKIIVDVLGEYSVVSVIVAEGRRGLKGEAGRSAYEQAVYMGLFTGTVEQWMQQIADASSAADRAENAAVAANIGSKVYATPQAGVNINTGVPAGDYFNVRSLSSNHYVDEYQNVAGVATATGKSYPNIGWVERNAAIAEAAAISATISSGIYQTPSAGVAPVTGVPVGDYFNVRSVNSEHYVDEYQNVAGVATATGKSYPSSLAVDLTKQQILDVSDRVGSTWRNKVGGYGLNDRVMLENGDIVKSTVANNTVNPNFDMTVWVNESNHNSSYGLMTGSRIQDVKDGVPSFDASGIIQSLITNPSEGDATIKRGTYFIGSSGIQIAGVKDKKIIFEKGVVLKWHPLVAFSTNVRMFSLTDCENTTFDDMVLRGANNPDVWVKTEKVIRAGLIDKQTGVLQINCKKIKFNAPDIQNFQWGIYTLASGLNKSSRIEINDGYLTGNYCGIVWESYIINGITSCDILNTRSNNNWKWGMWMEAGDLSKDSRYIRNIKMIGGSLSGQVEEHGCYVQGEDHLFSGVDFENNNSAGLRMYSCARLRVVGNKFTGNGFNANGIGYLAGAAFIGTDTDGSAEPIRSNNVIISDNVSTGNRFTFADYKLDNSIIVANNVCTGNGTADGLTDGDIVFRSNQNSKISNNIIRDSLCATGILVRDQGNSLSKNIDVNDNMVIGQKGIGIKYQWGASETDSEMIRIRGNTVKGSTSHGILVELKTRETRFVEITGNNTQYNGGDGIKTFAGATATCSLMRVTDNSSTFNTGYGLNFNGVSGGAVYGLLEKNNHVQRNNSSRVQIFQPATGGAGYGTSQLAVSGMRRTVTFSLKDVAVAASGEIQLKLDGVIPYCKISAQARVKAIEFYTSKGITGGSLSATVRAHTGVGIGTNALSASLTTTITAGGQDKSVTNAMNASSDRISASNRYYVGVDMDNPVVAGGGTVDLLCNIILDYSDDWRFEVAL